MSTASRCETATVQRSDDRARRVADATDGDGEIAEARLGAAGRRDDDPAMRPARRILSLLALLPSCASPPAARDAAPAWRELFDGASLDGWQPSGFGGGGPIEVHDGRLILDFGSPLTGITWCGGELPRLDYEIEVEAARLAGTDFFCALTFPVGDQHASLVLGGWGGSLCGISCVDGEDAAHNETERHVGFPSGTMQRIRLHVQAERIRAWLGDEPLVDLPIAGRALAVRPELARSRPLGIASYATRASIAALRIRSTAR